MVHNPLKGQIVEKLFHGPDTEFSYVDGGIIKIRYKGNQVQVADIMNGFGFFGFQEGQELA